MKDYYNDLDEAAKVTGQSKESLEGLKKVLGNQHMEDGGQRDFNAFIAFSANKKALREKKEEDAKFRRYVEELEGQMMSWCDLCKGPCQVSDDKEHHKQAKRLQMAWRKEATKKATAYITSHDNEVGQAYLKLDAKMQAMWEKVLQRFLFKQWLEVSGKKI